ncbi:MAG: GNAT family N-acetyltransferase [Tepidisphaeraceae bacterium]|jgi:N-acetylglutamate synthase-like GNAT family acetyltransferase
MSHAVGNEVGLSPQMVLARQCKVRSFKPGDEHHVWRLYREGLLAGHLDPVDPLDDLRNIEDYYLAHPRRHFWVAQAFGDIVGTVAIATEEDGVAHLRRLRVAPRWPDRDMLATTLMETALDHAREQGAIKLALHTPVNQEGALELMTRHGFQFARSRQIHGRDALEFYITVYDPIHLPPDHAPG